MFMITELEALRYNEAMQLPKFRASLERLLNKEAYVSILSVQSLTPAQLPQFVEKALSEGNAVMIQREWGGYMVILWKDK